MLEAMVTLQGQGSQDNDQWVYIAMALSYPLMSSLTQRKILRVEGRFLKLTVVRKITLPKWRACTAKFTKSAAGMYWSTVERSGMVGTKLHMANACS